MNDAIAVALIVVLTPPAAAIASYAVAALSRSTRPAMFAALFVVAGGYALLVRAIGSGPGGCLNCRITDDASGITNAWALALLTMLYAAVTAVALAAGWWGASRAIGRRNISPDRD